MTIKRVIAASRLPHADDIEATVKHRRALARLLKAEEEGRPVYRIIQRELDTHVRAIIACYADGAFETACEGMRELASLLKRCEQDGTIDCAKGVFREYIEFVEEWASYFAESPLIVADFKRWYAAQTDKILVARSTVH